MPKSKRNKLVTLSKVTSKRKEGKSNLIDQIRKSLDSYKYAYVFSFHNMRTSLLKKVRLHWNSSRFFFGKNKVMQIALGRTPEDEYKENTHKIGEEVTGNCGLFFTNESEEDIVKFFRDYREKDYARSGFIATDTVVLAEGPCERFQHSMEPFLRTQLGVPTSLRKGVVYLEKDFTVCKLGEELTPEQARLLKLLDIKMSEFYLQPLCVWFDGEYKTFHNI